MEHIIALVITLLCGWIFWQRQDIKALESRIRTLNLLVEHYQKRIVEESVLYRGEGVSHE